MTDADFENWNEMWRRIVDAVPAEYFPDEVKKGSKTGIRGIAMPCSSSLPQQGHRQKNVPPGLFPWPAMVTRPVSRKELAENTKARDALKKEFEGHWKRDVYDFSVVREYDDLRAEAKRTGETIHLARVHGLIYEKNYQLPEGHPQRKYKGRGVLLGDQVKDQNFEAALFQDLGSSPASFDTARWVDMYGCLPGHECQMADAIQAYIQAILTGTPCWVELPLDAWPPHIDISKFRRPMVRLVKELYGHPDAGTMWEQHCHEKLVAIGWRPVGGEWPSLYFHDQYKLLLAVYVDDLKMSGPKENLAKGWAEIRKVLDLEEEQPLGLYLGCKVEKFCTKLHNGADVNAISYSMYDLLDMSVRKYCDITGLKMESLNQVDTLSTAEDTKNHPARRPVVPGASVAKCTWRATDLPVGSDGKLLNVTSTCRSSSTAGTPSAPENEETKSRGVLAPHAASVLMKLLYAARIARFDLLRAINSLARNVTKWSKADDKRLRHLMCYVNSTKTNVMVGWVGDKLEDLVVGLFADADYAGCGESLKSTSGVHMQIQGPNTRFPVAGQSKRQGSISHSTPEAEIVAADYAMSKVGIPAITLWTCLSPTQPRIIFYDDSQAMISVIRSGKNPTMRHLERTHGLCIAWMHEVFMPDTILLVYEITAKMAADIHTKPFKSAEAWKHACSLINVFDSTDISQPWILELMKPTHDGSSDLGQSWYQERDGVPCFPYTNTPVLPPELYVPGLSGRDGLQTVEGADPVFMMKTPRVLRPAPVGLPGGRYLRSTWILRDGGWHRIEDHAEIPDERQRFDAWVERAVHQFHPVAAAAASPAALGPRAPVLGAGESLFVDLLPAFQKGCFRISASPRIGDVIDYMLRVVHGGSSHLAAKSSVWASTTSQFCKNRKEAKTEHSVETGWVDGDRTNAGKVAERFIPASYQVESSSESGVHFAFVGVDAVELFSMIVAVSASESFRPSADSQDVLKGMKVKVFQSNGGAPRVVTFGVGTEHRWQGSYDQGCEIHRKGVAVDDDNMCERVIQKLMRGKRDMVVLGSGWFGTQSLMSFRDNVNVQHRNARQAFELARSVINAARKAQCMLAVEMQQNGDSWTKQRAREVLPRLYFHVSMLDCKFGSREAGTHPVKYLCTQTSFYTSVDVDVSELESRDCRHPLPEPFDDGLDPTHGDIARSSEPAAVILEQVSGARHHAERVPAYPSPSIGHKDQKSNSRAPKNPKRVLIEYCCGENSKLSQSRKVTKGCTRIRVTEANDPRKRKNVCELLEKVLESCDEHTTCLVHASLPCTGGSPWQHVNRKLFGVEKSNEQRKLFTQLSRSLRKFMNMLRSAHKGIVYLSVELPSNCAYWKWPVAQDFCAYFELKMHEFDGCAVGVVNKHGQSLRKRWCIATDMSELCCLDKFQCECSSHGASRGQALKDAEGYTFMLTDCIHRAFAQAAQRHVMLQPHVCGVAKKEDTARSILKRRSKHRGSVLVGCPCLVAEPVSSAQPGYTVRGKRGEGPVPVEHPRTGCWTWKLLVTLACLLVSLFAMAASPEPVRIPDWVRQTYPDQDLIVLGSRAAWLNEQQIILEGRAADSAYLREDAIAPFSSPMSRNGLDQIQAWIRAHENQLSNLLAVAFHLAAVNGQQSEEDNRRYIMGMVQQAREAQMNLRIFVTKICSLLHTVKTLLLQKSHEYRSILEFWVSAHVVPNIDDPFRALLHDINNSLVRADRSAVDFFSSAAYLLNEDIGNSQFAGVRPVHPDSAMGKLRSTLFYDTMERRLRLRPRGDARAEDLPASELAELAHRVPRYARSIYYCLRRLNYNAECDGGVAEWNMDFAVERLLKDDTDHNNPLQAQLQNRLMLLISLAATFKEYVDCPFDHDDATGWFRWNPLPDGVRPLDFLRDVLGEIQAPFENSGIGLREDFFAQWYDMCAAELGDTTAVRSRASIHRTWTDALEDARSRMTLLGTPEIFPRFGDNRKYDEDDGPNVRFGWMLPVQHHDVFRDREVPQVHYVDRPTAETVWDQGETNADPINASYEVDYPAPDSQGPAAGRSTAASSSSAPGRVSSAHGGEEESQPEPSVRPIDRPGYGFYTWRLQKPDETLVGRLRIIIATRDDKKVAIPVNVTKTEEGMNTSEPTFQPCLELAPVLDRPHFRNLDDMEFRRTRWCIFLRRITSHLAHILGVSSNVFTVSRFVSLPDAEWLRVYALLYQMIHLEAAGTFPSPKMMTIAVDPELVNMTEQAETGLETSLGLLLETLMAKATDAISNNNIDGDDVPSVRDAITMLVTDYVPTYKSNKGIYTDVSQGLCQFGRSHLMQLYKCEPFHVESINDPRRPRKTFAQALDELASRLRPGTGGFPAPDEVAEVSGAMRTAGTVHMHISMSEVVKYEHNRQRVSVETLAIPEISALLKETYVDPIKNIALLMARPILVDVNGDLELFANPSNCTGNLSAWAGTLASMLRAIGCVVNTSGMLWAKYRQFTKSPFSVNPEYNHGQQLWALLDKHLMSEKAVAVSAAPHWDAIEPFVDYVNIPAEHYAAVLVPSELSPEMFLGRGTATNMSVSFSPADRVRGAETWSLVEDDPMGYYELDMVERRYWFTDGQAKQEARNSGAMNPFCTDCREDISDILNLQQPLTSENDSITSANIRQPGTCLECCAKAAANSDHYANFAEVRYEVLILRQAYEKVLEDCPYLHVNVFGDIREFIIVNSHALVRTRLGKRLSRLGMIRFPIQQVIANLENNRGSHMYVFRTIVQKTSVSAGGAPIHTIAYTAGYDPGNKVYSAFCRWLLGRDGLERLGMERGSADELLADCIELALGILFVASTTPLNTQTRISRIFGSHTDANSILQGLENAIQRWAAKNAANGVFANHRKRGAISREWHSTEIGDRLHRQWIHNARTLRFMIPINTDPIIDRSNQQPLPRQRERPRSPTASSGGMEVDEGEGGSPPVEDSAGPGVSVPEGEGDSRPVDDVAQPEAPVDEPAAAATPPQPEPERDGDATMGVEEETTGQTAEEGRRAKRLRVAESLGRFLEMASGSDFCVVCGAVDHNLDSCRNAESLQRWYQMFVAGED